MMRPLPPELRCPTHGAKFQLIPAASGPTEPSLQGDCGCVFPVHDGIPRFVSGEGHAESFGLQWNAFRRTQLDSHSGSPVSRNRLTRCFGGSLESVRGASVLEAGCGAGRFTEVLLDAGARVFAFDLSNGVEANAANCGDRPGYFVCQADATALPVARESFDFVVALGMVQHTPSPEATIAVLAGALRPGGILVVDHYRSLRFWSQLLNPLRPRTILRTLLLRLDPHLAFRVTDAIVDLLLPIHRMLWRRGLLVGGLRAVWRRVSPVFDYYDSFPELGDALAEWARLDTHDGLTDRHKHLRTPEEIEAALRATGLEVIACQAGGNGVEARARRPRTE